MGNKKDSKELGFKLPLGLPGLLRGQYLVCRTINPEREIFGVDDKGDYTISLKDGRKRYLRFRKPTPEEESRDYQK